MDNSGTESELGIEGLIEEGEALRRFIAVPPVPCAKVTEEPVPERPPLTPGRDLPP
jgi:hypothetical protein